MADDPIVEVPIVSGEPAPPPVTRRAPGLSTDALQMLAGVATIPSELMRAGAIVANPNRFIRQVRGEETEEDRSRTGGVAQVLQGTGDAWNNIVNRTLGVQDPSILDNTAEAAARFAGGALPALPFRLPAAIATRIATMSTPARMAINAPVKLAELLTPTTVTNSTTTAGRMGARAANVGVQMAAGGAIEKVAEPFDPTQPVNVYDTEGNLLTTQAPQHTAGVGRVVANAVGDAVKDHPIATALGGATLLAAGLAGARGLHNARVQRDLAATSDVMVPRDRTGGDVPIIDTSTLGGKVRNAANRFAEVVQDANIRTKDAVRQADPTGYQSTREAIDMNIEASHKNRVLEALESGQVVTPRGIKSTESLRRIAEDLYHRSIGKPQLNKDVKELLIMETEADNRLYQMHKGNRDSVEIDTATGKLADVHTPPQNRARVTPRATLHHLSDQDLARKIVDIRRSNPEAVQIAERYWKLHKDLADSWVDWGLLSKNERYLWGRANPQFMHTINFDDPKSPRTYRLREHGSGPQHGGDPLLAAAEYADFMLGHAYRNRMRKQIVESLRTTRGGPFGNGEWLGKVAHPAELRRTFRPGTRHPMTKADVPITGDRVHYYDNGEMVDVEVRNKQLLHTMETMPHHAATVMGWFRQVAQSGMTGKLATAVGQPFGVANGFMGAMAGYVNRPLGKSFGRIDRFVQEKSGGKFGVRMDPTAIPGMLNSGIRDVSAVLTRATSEAFYNSIAHSGFLSKLPNAQAIADGAAKRYGESLHAQSNRIGSGNASTLGDHDFDTAGGRASLVSTVTPHGNLARVISDPKDWKEVIQLYAGRATPADIKIAARLFGDINDAIGNMAQSYMFRSNQHKVKSLDDAARVPEAAYAHAMAQAQPHLDRVKTLRDTIKTTPNLTPQSKQRLQHQIALEEQRAAPFLATAQQHENAAVRAREEWYKEYRSLGVATRQLLGDPGQIGTGLRDLGRSGMQSKLERLAGLVLDATPYANIGMQAAARLIRAAKENPLGTATSIGLLGGSMVIAPLWNAIRLDDERMARGEEPIHVPYELSRPSWDASRFILGHIGGIDPDQSPRLRIDPLLSLPLTLFRESFIAAMGLNGDPRLDPTQGYTRQAIGRIAESRVWNNIATAALNAQPISQLPPAFGAGAAAMGIELPPFEKLVSRGGANPIPTHGMGGFDQSRLAHDVTTTRVDVIAGQLAGGAGMTFVGAVRSGWQSERRRPGTFVGAAMDEVLGRSKDRLPEFQPLWDQPSRRATSNNLADMVNAKEQVMEVVRQNIATAATPGTVGPGRYAERGTAGGGAQGVDDPRMRQLLTATAQFSQSMQELRSARAKVRKMMLDTEQEALPYADRRVRLNELSGEIGRINSELLARYTRFEDQVSERLGVKVRLEAMDPSRPLTQFSPNR